VAEVGATMGVQMGAVAAKATIGAIVPGVRLVRLVRLVGLGGLVGLVGTEGLAVTTTVKAAEVEIVPVRFHRLL
jgi:hypothetical protein